MNKFKTNPESHTYLEESDRKILEDKWKYYGPTLYAAVQTWLRRFHYVHVVPELRPNAGIYVCWIYYLQPSDKGSCAHKIGEYSYVWSYEEALKMGIKAAITQGKPKAL